MAVVKKKKKGSSKGKKKESNPNSVFNTMLREADALNITETEKRFQKILDARKGKIVKADPLIEFITSNTNRVESNEFKTKENEFEYRDGKVVKPNVYYHIHYTTDLSEYYMTDTEHSPKSKVINRIQNNTDFRKYNVLNKQRVLSIPPSRVSATDTDYKRGFMFRYFATKTNDTTSPVFEISKDNFQSSPLYDYSSVQWKITGTKNQVRTFNENQIESASESIPSLTKLLSPFQMYKATSDLDPAELVRDRLNLKDPSELTALDFFAANRSDKKKKSSKSKKSKSNIPKQTTSTQTTSTRTTSAQSTGGGYSGGGSSGGSSGVSSGGSSGGGY